MPKNLVIVESPAKAKTIERYLGRDYKVVASYGHVRDLPKSKLGIDVEHGFKPDYIVPRGLGKQIAELKKTTGAAQTVYLATDLDREGEAIAWHLSQLIPAKPGQKWQRITFSEITKPAIEAAIAHPRAINQHLVDAQQARRILDRLVGYTLSPVLWKKIRYGLSAGRVQSVALRFIVDREREIEAFKPEKYWTVRANLKADGAEFVADLQKIDGKKAELKTATVADGAVEQIKKHPVVVVDSDSRETSKNPPPPFTTSTLQQAAYRRLGYSTRRTMTVAQRLYEAGHISYMRTDSVVLSDQALAQATKQIADQFGKDYALTQPRRYKRAAKAQEAHEAVRPTDFRQAPEAMKAKLPADEARLYQLIWQRATASQMQSARYRQNGINLAAGKKGEYGLRATGRETLFDGYSRVYGEAEAKEQQVLPSLKPKTEAELIDVVGEGHETQPPPRYTEAALVKQLEAEGIGRPSTYAPIISTLLNRGYVLSEDKKLVPQPVGMLVNDLLAKNFHFVVDPGFTAKIEDQLDEIAAGASRWQPVVEEFYEPMAHDVATKQDKIERVKIPVIPTNEKCEVCGRPMVIKSGRFGQFLACSGWPECKNTKPLLKDTGVECPKCHQGSVVERKTKKGRTFYGCSRYPDCDYATWQKPKKTSSESLTETI